MVGRGIFGIRAYDDHWSEREGWFLSGFVDLNGEDMVMVLPDYTSKAVSMRADKVSLRPMFQERTKVPENV